MSQIYRASFFTLGCRLNQSESAIISKGFEKRGYEIVGESETTDVAVINTCTVTENSDAKCRYAIRRILRNNPKAYIAVVGCYSQIGADQIAGIEGVDLIVGNQDKMDVARLIDSPVKENKPRIIVNRIDRNPFIIETIGQSQLRTRANLKIQDGCDFMCSFCIIPFARGRARPRNWNNLVDEVRELAFSGFKEIVLSGVNIGTFDINGKSIVQVVDLINEFSGIERIRISSIEPTTIPDEILQRMADPDHSLVPFLHIPLQSGSDDILTAMRRLYKTKDWSEYIIKAHKNVPDICIGTDVMVGFPGETEAHFIETKKFLADLPLAYFHVFNYSERKGTKAVKMDDKVPHAERVRRSEILREMSKRKRIAFNHRFLGQEMPVLFEEIRDDGSYAGYTENYIRVIAESEKDISNQIVSVSLQRPMDNRMLGSIIKLALVKE